MSEPAGKSSAIPVAEQTPHVLRLLLVSSKAKFANQLGSASKWNVKTIMYQYESSSLEDIIGLVDEHLGSNRVGSIALIFHGTENEMFLCGVGHEVLSVTSASDFRQSIRSFFVRLGRHLDAASKPRVDILACPFTQGMSDSIKAPLKELLSCPIGISQDLNGSDILVPSTQYSSQQVPLGVLYFNQDKLKEILSSSIGTLQRSSRMQNLSDYEKIRIVGKGAFGTAVLYRKKDDDSLVILKEINMHDLTALERQLAMNEVKVLSMLDHPNIVSYYDSFEQDGVLMIEMEYADGGTLAQYLAKQKKPLDEEECLFYFHQIVSAICYMHEHHILHRDLKTANIFLTKENVVKVGDFGISKMLTTRQGGANTVVGTPYYISPEMCEGKAYNQKSDIWALGCILYEMACRHKTFEGSNLPALVNKIVKGQFAPVKGGYSAGFKQLIRDLLQKDPDFRPTAQEILYQKVAELQKQFQADANEEEEVSMDYKVNQHSRSALKHPRSVLYHVIMHEMNISLTPVPLPPRSRIREVAVSPTHMIALTYELLAYTWGDGKKGQLGHGTKENWRSKPACVEALKGKNISRVCAGDGFSVFASDNGIVMTCGDGALGCLGRGDWNCCTKPQLIERLLSVDVSALNCGPQHVVVVTGDGGAFAWGCGSGGRLGTGNEDDCCTPMEVKVPDHAVVQQVFCGLDGTVFVTASRGALACGRNDWNKLGLNERRGFLMQMKQLMVKTEVEKSLVPKRLRWLQNRVISVSMGASHTAILVEPGRVITMGCNQEGQLGRGSARNHATPMVVKSMMNKTVTMVQCGSTFTVAGTVENVVYFWGGRRISNSPPLSHSIDANSLQDPVLQSLRTFELKSNKAAATVDEDEPSFISETSVSEVIKIGENNSPLMREVERIGPDSPIIQVKTPEAKMTNSNASLLMAANKSQERASPTGRNTPDIASERKNLVLYPEEILALYASPAQIAKGEIVSLANIYCYGNHLYLAVDTTAPLPRPRKKKQQQQKRANLGSSTEDFLSESPTPPESGAKGSPQTSVPSSLESSQVDSMGPIPQWLKEELEDAVIPGAAPDAPKETAAANADICASKKETGCGTGAVQLTSAKPRRASCSKLPIPVSKPVTSAALQAGRSLRAKSLIPVRPKSSYCVRHCQHALPLTHSYPASHPALRGGGSKEEVEPPLVTSCSCLSLVDGKESRNTSCQASSCESIVTCIPSTQSKAARELELESKLREMDEENRRKGDELTELRKEIERRAEQQEKDKEAFEAEVAKVKDELNKKNQAFQECQRQLQKLQDQIQDLTKQQRQNSPSWISEPLTRRKKKQASRICSIQ